MKAETDKGSDARDHSEPEASEIEVTTRQHRIAQAAYYRAERRGFCPGCELEDWLEAEKEIEAQLERPEKT